MSFLFNKNKKEKEAAKAAAAAAQQANNKSKANGGPSAPPQQTRQNSNRGEGPSRVTEDQVSQNEPHTPPRGQRQALPGSGQASSIQGQGQGQSRGPGPYDNGARNVSSSVASGIPEPGRYRDVSGTSSTNDVFSSNPPGPGRSYSDREDRMRTSSNSSSANQSHRATSPVIERESPRSRHQGRQRDPTQGRSGTSGKTQHQLFPWTTRTLHQTPSIPNSFPSRSPFVLNDPENKSKLPSPGSFRDHPPFPRYGAAVASCLPPVPPSILPNLTPRRGEAVPQVPNSGEIWMFGGLVGDMTTSETFLMTYPYQPSMSSGAPVSRENAEETLNGVSISFVETTGECPSPRMGHASCFVQGTNSNSKPDDRPGGGGGGGSASRDGIFVVWGGDTRTREDEALDGDLYLLNTSTRHWHRIALSHSSSGRYGHTISHIGNKIVAWGGQDGDYLFDEMITFDLGSLRTHDFTWEGIQYATVPPSRRTGHVSAVYGGRLYISSGMTADGCVSDTWVYDFESRVWTELTCVGYVPTAREGGSATVVGDVVYLFGGRNSQNEELSDLSAFRIANQRWYMFQNMGESPSARSGHALASIGAKIFVLGGEAFNPKPVLDAKGLPIPFTAENPEKLGVLDTIKIKFPPATSPPPNAQPRFLSIEQFDDNRQDDATPKLPLVSTFPSNQSINNRAGEETPFHNDQDQSSRHNGVEQRHSLDRGAHEDVETSELSRAQLSEVNGGKNNPAHIQTQTGAASTIAAQPDTVHSPQSPKESLDSTSSHRAHGDTNFRASQQSNFSDVANERTSPRDRDSAVKQSILDHVERTPPRTSTALSSRRTEGVLSPPPSDAFYYSSDQSQSQTRSREQDDVPDSSTADSSVGPTSDPSVHIERSNRAMRAELHMLRQSRRLSKLSPQHSRTITDDSAGQNHVIDMILDLRKILENTRLDLEESQMMANQRIGDAMRARAAALQEAAALKAKLVSMISDLPTNSPLKVSEVRVNEMESRLGRALREKTAAVSRLKVIEDEFAAERRDKEELQSQMQVYQDQSTQMMEEREALLAQVDELREKHGKMSTTSRDHQAKCIDLGRKLEAHQADIAKLRDLNQNLTDQNHGHSKTVAQTSTALEAANAHALKAESMYQAAHKELEERSAEHKESQRVAAELRSQLQSALNDVETARSRANDLSSLLDQVREENHALKNVTHGNISQFLASHHESQSQTKDLANEPNPLHSLQNEIQSIRALHDQSQESVRSLESELAQVQSQLRDQESKTSKARHALSETQARLTSTQNILSRTQRQYSDRENEIQDHLQGLEASELRAELLKSVVQDNGLLMSSRTTTPANGQHSASTSVDLQDVFAKVEHLSAVVAQRSRNASGSQRSVSKMSQNDSETPSDSHKEANDMQMQDSENQAKLRDLTRQKDDALHLAASAEQILAKWRVTYTGLEQEVVQLRQKAAAGNETQLRLQLDLATKQLDAERSTKQQYLATVTEHYTQQIKNLERQVYALQMQAGRSEDSSPLEHRPTMQASDSNLDDDFKQFSQRRAGLETRHRKGQSSEISMGDGP